MNERNFERTLAKRLRASLDPLGDLLAEGFHFLGLFAIGAATVYAAIKAYIAMFAGGRPTIEDLLLLFIYLEVGSMIGIYFRTKHMPVRFLLYVGITVLTRHLIGYAQVESAPDAGILILAGGIFTLACAVFIIRYATFYYPSSKDGPEEDAD